MPRRLEALAALLVLAAAGLSYARKNPDIALLPPVEGASWIVSPAPMNLRIWAYGELFHYFRKRFSVAEVPPRAVFTVFFMKDAAVLLDGRVILAPTRRLDAWKTPRTLDLAAGLKPGAHELLVNVLNKGGPPAMAASCPALGLATGADWEASPDRARWSPARRADEFRGPGVAREFPSALEAFAEAAPVYAVVFVFIFFWASSRSLPPSPLQVKRLLLAAAALLAANNLVKFPAGIGMDVSDHLEYIRQVAQKGRLPLAGEGWQMFQAPLYYILSAPLYLVFSALGDASFCEKALRIIPLACWLGQIELTYRFMRLIFPQRPDLQAAGTLIGGLLPMNIYVSQALGNEPLAALLSAWTLFLAARLAAKDRASMAEFVQFGAVLGLALLAKLSAFLLIAPLAWLIAGAGRRRRALAALAAALLVCGWFYLRNWIELGRPFIAGSWDSMREKWWQEPGYRSLRDFVSFGETLRFPIYAGLNGFWDSLYSTFWLDGYLSGITTFRSRPPWNFSLMISSAWLALLPSAAILLGLLRASAERAPRALRLSLYCVLLYAAALMALYLRLPIYSTGKASYLSGLTPCWALLAASGWEMMTRRAWARRLAYAGLGCWVFSAYASYWAL